MAFWKNDRHSRARRKPTSVAPAAVEQFESRVLLTGVTDDRSTVDDETLNSLSPNQVFASIDGTGNNLANPELGSTDEQVLPGVHG